MPSGSSRIDRRTAIKTGAAALAVAATFAQPHVARAQAEGPIKVPALPYSDDALAPVISANTIGFHYGKHHVGYATALNAALAGPAKDYAAMSLEDIIKTSRANIAPLGRHCGLRIVDSIVDSWSIRVREGGTSANFRATRAV